MIIDSKFGLGFILGFLSYHSYKYFFEKIKKNDIFIKQDVVNKIIELTQVRDDKNDKDDKDDKDYKDYKDDKDDKNDKYIKEYYYETSEDLILDEEIYNQLTSEEDELYEIKIILNKIIYKIIKK